MIAVSASRASVVSQSCLRLCKLYLGPFSRRLISLSVKIMLVLFKDDDVSSRTFIAQCTTELVQCLDKRAAVMVCHFPGIRPKSTPLHPRRLCPSPSQLMALSSPSFLMENANGAIPYSVVSFQARNGETSFRHLSQYGAKNHRLRVDISAAVLR